MVRVFPCGAFPPVLPSAVGGPPPPPAPLLWLRPLCQPAAPFMDDAPPPLCVCVKWPPCGAGLSRPAGRGGLRKDPTASSEDSAGVKRVRRAAYNDPKLELSTRLQAERRRYTFAPSELRARHLPGAG